MHCAVVLLHENGRIGGNGIMRLTWEEKDGLVSDRRVANAP